MLDLFKLTILSRLTNIFMTTHSYVTKVYCHTRCDLSLDMTTHVLGDNAL